MEMEHESAKKVLKEIEELRKNMREIDPKILEDAKELRKLLKFKENLHDPKKFDGLRKMVKDPKFMTEIKNSKLGKEYTSVIQNFNK